MKSARLLTLSCLLTVVMASPPARGQELWLYTPKPADADRAPGSPDEGILVKTVTVKRGDTLAKLSREHLGVAGKFSQVLLFNSIKNPDLIHTGEKLRIPVPPGRAVAEKKSGDRKSRHARRPSSRSKSAAKQLMSPSPSATAAEQESYQRAKRAYLDADYQKALGLFAGFLRKFPHSKHAADASLYRADCFLRLSGE